MPEFSHYWVNNSIEFNPIPTERNPTMNTITKTHITIDITAGGASLHRVPAVRWTVTTGDATARIDLVASTAIVAAEGDRRDIATLLAALTAMGFDLDVDEDDQHLEWMIGYGGRVWGVAPEVITDHCQAALDAYCTPCPVA